MHSTWQQFYRQHLGQPDIHYWEWRDKPESGNVGSELAGLLKLSEPTGFVREVLESLAEGVNPFELPFGRFSDRPWQVQRQMRLAFKQWHDLARRQVGRKSLEKIYQICYGTPWRIIREIIQRPAGRSQPWWQVLGVPPTASSLEVETAYKQLMKIWHPDLNQHPLSTQITARINVAYEQYLSRHRVSSKKDSPKRDSHANWQIRRPTWLNPLIFP